MSFDSVIGVDRLEQVCDLWVEGDLYTAKMIHDLCFCGCMTIWESDTRKFGGSVGIELER